MNQSTTPTLENEKILLAGAIFIDTADEDYILARWCCFNRFSKQFFWNAAQAIEKYLKASLLLNGRSSKGYKHNLNDLFRDVESYAKDLIPNKLVSPPQVELLNQNPDLWGDSAVKEFVSRVNIHGDPSNRYDFFGIELEVADLFKLDQVIFVFRNLAVKLDDVVDANRCMNPQDGGLTYAEIIKNKPDAQLFPFKDNLVHSKQTSTSIHESARENNYPFAKNYAHSKSELMIHQTVSRLEMLYSGEHLPFSREIKVWFESNIECSKNDKRKLMQLGRYKAPHVGRQ